MAINIFQGSSSKSTKSVNSAKNSSRAQQAKAALAEPAQVSNSGATAVGSNGTLAKVGNLIGTAANVASKFLPGVGGTIAGAVANMLNDPEWWQSIPGEAVTLNVSLALVDQDSVGLKMVQGSNTTEFINSQLRPTIGEFISGGPSDAAANAPNLYSNLVYIDYVIFPSTSAITQYLMPEIRKVVNATPLQSANEYRAVLQTNATVYAMWQQLKKIRFLLEHGKTYIPNMDDTMFPICQVSNHEKLTAYINRLEEYLRSHVRLPHTLCEYLAWRYGRIYNSNSAVKSGLIMYNVLSLSASITDWDNAISELLNITSANPQMQAASTDLYNAFFDHDSWVEIRDDTQFRFDPKEFALRTNSDVVEKVVSTFDITSSGTIIASLESNADDDPNPVYIDSSLDNPTAFMASTVSTYAKDNGVIVCLFPIKRLNSYWRNFQGYRSRLTMRVPYGDSSATLAQMKATFIDFDNNTWWAQVPFIPTESDGAWNIIKNDGTIVPDNMSGGFPAYYAISIDMAICKPLDIYNKNVHILLDVEDSGHTVRGRKCADLTSLAADMGFVPGQVISVEQIYAFANMTYAGRKTSMSYGQAEKLVSRDVANFVEKLDVAQAKA